jgi:hypothetical protein
MTYPPSPPRSRSHTDAESYELATYPHAGPSTPSANQRRHSGSGGVAGAKVRTPRKLTMHLTDTAADVLFSAPLSSGIAGSSGASATTPRRLAGRGRRRTVSITTPAGSPQHHKWANFLDEDGRDGTGDPAARAGASGRADEVQVNVPDFGHMLGFNPEEEDHYAVAREIRAEWRKRLYLLLEEPRSGREAFFVHIFVTGAILFR